MIRIGREAPRCLLARRGITFQRTKTWKESTDPERDAKLDRIEQVLEHFPDQVFAFDDLGPLGIRPTASSCWAKQDRPDRVPATCHRTHGVIYFHGCYSVGDDTLWGINRRHKGAAQSLAALKSIRAARPDGAPIYVIMDNLSAHEGSTIRQWARKNKVKLCFTPTNASWANPIEAHFGPLRQFTLANSNHSNHTVQTRLLHGYLRWRDNNARHPDVLAAQRKERARIRSEKGIGGEAAHSPTRPDQETRHPSGSQSEMAPRTLRYQSGENGRQLRRLDPIRQRVQVGPRDPGVLVEVGPFIGEQTGSHQRRLLLGEIGHEEVFRPDVPLAVPPHVTLHRHRTVKDRGRVQSGLLGQFTPCRHQRGLARFDSPTGRLPEPCPIKRITPVEKKQAVGSVQADHPRGGPMCRLHSLDTRACSELRSRDRSFPLQEGAGCGRPVA
ncbi:hypothetical protein M2155_008044 [Streptomyces sp. SAI-119]|nr:hypothetical protein [Streptomyces sp. SAI-119]